jgi:acetyltransferase-like isoleucine patch superfamily enzyme
MTMNKLRSLMNRISAIFAKNSLRLSGVEFGSGLTLHGAPIVSRVAGAKITLGRDVVLCSISRFTALGVNHPVVLRAMANGAEIRIGDNVGISGGTICAAESVTIGANTMFGANVTVADTDFHPLAPENRRNAQTGAQTAPVVIEENVFVGTGTIILKGVRIGKNSVIGAGSLVVRDIPANVIAAGNPCKTIRTLDQFPTAHIAVPN